ncbi:MAG: hypothetical protein MI922_14870, partial [Bacteroidales bacterium]|nr:hypothetical protein [Bacteroidales bacterium]
MRCGSFMRSKELKNPSCIGGDARATPSQSKHSYPHLTVSRARLHIKKSHPATRPRKNPSGVLTASPA